MKSPGKYASRNRYNYLTREIENKARLERERNRYLKALELAEREIEQMHSTLYPKCSGGCPAHEALLEIKKALDYIRPAAH